MEPDRYQQNSKLFIIGIVCLLLSLSLFAYSFYLLPHLLFGWVYDLPGFIFHWREWLKQKYNFSEVGAAWTIFLSFSIPALVCGYISYLTSNKVDNEIYGILPEDKETEEERIQPTSAKEDGLGFGFKLTLAIILVLMLISLLQWLLTIPPPLQE